MKGKMGVVVGLLLVLALTACGRYAYHGTVLPGEAAPDFALPAAQGGVFRLSEQRGKVVLLFFGYTHCPDVCPTTLAEARQVLEGLGEDARNVRFVFITVDPERDTLEALKAYTAHFHPDILALSGDMDHLRAVYEAYHVYIERVPAQGAATDYTVTHTARVFLVDPQGRLRLSYAFGTPWQDMVDDVRHVLKEGR